MTSRTGSTCVGAGQGKGRLNVMVKMPLRPVQRAVTGFALRSESSIVNVAGRVARTAIGSGVVKSERRVAVFASDGHVQPDQREKRKPMVEVDLFDPVRLDVTGLALIAELPRMRIRLVASNASRRQRNSRITHMARIAIEVRVRTKQRKHLHLIVVKACACPSGDSVTAPAVGPQSTHMHVFGLMAAVAACR